MTDLRKYSFKNVSEKITLKRKEVKDSMDKLESSLIENGVLLTEDRLHILALSFQDLTSKLQKGKLSAVDTLKAFQAKAIEETKKTNCVTEFITNAEIWAKERDETVAELRKSLHGVPISIKENFDVVGMETTLGLVKNLGNFKTSNAVIVSTLMEEGAVPFVKTNVPQLICSAGCSNPIYGSTNNPFNATRSAGGSSGGEAALIAKGGSFLGVGSDMLGSVRIPASFCGTFALKPTQKRVSRNGSYGAYKSLIGIANTSGLLGRNTDVLVAGMKALFQKGMMTKLDPTVPYIPWNSHHYDSRVPLKVGWLEEDKFFPVTPGCKRAIHMAKLALERRGHKVIPFNDLNLQEIYDCGLDIAFSEGGAVMLDHWKGEIVDDSLKINKNVLSAPSFVKFIMEKYFSLWSPIMAKMASQKAKTSPKLWKAVTRKKIYEEKLIKSWTDKELDVILGPAFPLPAPHPSEVGNLIPACIYFAIYNFCDFPSGVLPITYQTEEDIKQMHNYPAYDYIFNIIKKETEKSDGMPLNVQIAGLPWQEEKVLRTMKEIQLGLNIKK